MPHQRMAMHHHAVRAGIVEQRIRLAEAEHAPLRLQVRHLHDVFGGQAVEIAFDQALRCGLANRLLAAVPAGTATPMGNSGQVAQCRYGRGFRPPCLRKAQRGCQQNGKPHKYLVERRRIELPTFALRTRRSPS